VRQRGATGESGRGGGGEMGRGTGLQGLPAERPGEEGLAGGGTGERSGWGAGARKIGGGTE
jgi:hypothetical protein